MRHQVTYLELAAGTPVRGRDDPAVALVPVANDDPRGRAMTERVGRPFHWGSLRSSADEWAEAMHDPTLRSWLVLIADEPAGVLAARAHGPDDVQIVRFGLAAEYIGHGYGGPALTLAVHAARGLGDPGAEPRVWLSTSSLDHPNALSNYRARGFTITSTEERDKQPLPPAS